jgi:peptidoglycan/LPS O-acetylase OafA/YrhL
VGAYRPEIDGLRFFAIAFVIFGHSLERAARFFPSYRDSLGGGVYESYLQLAPLGVNLFFAISGFILTNQAIKANASPLSAAFLKSYFGRRILRIEPPYFILLVATFLLISATGFVPDGVHRFDVEPKSLSVSLLSSIFYCHDLVWGSFPRLFPPGWSLEVEVQFYLLAPLLFWMWRRFSTTSSRALLSVGFLGLGIVLSALDIERVGPLFVRFSLLHSCVFFCVGIVLAYRREEIAARLATSSRALTAALGWSGLILCFLLPAAEHPPFLPEVFRLAGVCLGLAAMFASTFAPNSGFRAFCARPWISLIGGACYSIYLVHLQIIQVFSGLVFKLAPGLPLVGVAAAFVASAVLVVAIGLTYYVQIERRFMTPNWHVAVVQRPRGRGAPAALQPASSFFALAVAAATTIALVLVFGLVYFA